MYDKLTGRFRETLRVFPVLRRPRFEYLFLLCSRRLHNKHNQRESNAESTKTDDQDDLENKPQSGYFGLYQRNVISRYPIMYGAEDNCHVACHSEEVNFAWALSRLTF